MNCAQVLHVILHNRNSVHAVQACKVVFPSVCKKGENTIQSIKMVPSLHYIGPEALGLTATDSGV